MPEWITWRVGGYVAVAIAAALLAWRVNAWHKGYRQLPEAVAALEASEAGRAQDAAQWAAESARVETVTRGYVNELATLRGAAAATPVRSVRLCIDSPTVPAAPAAPAAAAGVHDSIAGSGELPAAPRPNYSAGADIGADLYAAADAADAIVASCRALQGYVTGLP